MRFAQQNGLLAGLGLLGLLLVAASAFIPERGPEERAWEQPAINRGMPGAESVLSGFERTARPPATREADVLRQRPAEVAPTAPDAPVVRVNDAVRERLSAWGETSQDFEAYQAEARDVDTYYSTSYSERLFESLGITDPDSSLEQLSTNLVGAAEGAEQLGETERAIALEYLQEWSKDAVAMERARMGSFSMPSGYRARTEVLKARLAAKKSLDEELQRFMSTKEVVLRSLLGPPVNEDGYLTLLVPSEAANAAEGEEL